MEQLFIGYDKDFYDAIPYVKVEPGPDEDPYPQRWAIEPSFVEIASKLLFQKNNAKVYEEYGLPDDDEIRGFILGHPEFLFYAPELKKLFDLIKDARIFAELLRNPFFSIHLDELHRFEGTFIFFKFFLEVRGVEALVEELASVYSCIIDAGKSYCAMSADAKRRAADLLRNTDARDALEQIASGFIYSNAALGLNRHEKDRVMGKHTIERIASTREGENAEQWIKDYTRAEDDEIYVALYFFDFQYYWVYNERRLPVAILKIIDGKLTNIITDRDVPLTENGLLTAILNWLLDVGYSMGKDTLKEEGE